MCYRIKILKKNILWSDNYGNRDHNRNLGKSFLGQGPGSQRHKTIFSKQVLGWSDDCYTQNGQNGQMVRGSHGHKTAAGLLSVSLS